MDTTTDHFTPLALCVRGNSHNQLLQTVFSECTEEVATSLIPHSYQFPEICAFIIGFSFTVWTKKSAKKVGTSKRMLTKFVSISSYSPEVRTFGTLIRSTKVFSLIIRVIHFDYNTLEQL